MLKFNFSGSFDRLTRLLCFRVWFSEFGCDLGLLGGCYFDFCCFVDDLLCIWLAFLDLTVCLLWCLLDLLFHLICFLAFGHSGFGISGFLCSELVDFGLFLLLTWRYVLVVLLCGLVLLIWGWYSAAFDVFCFPVIYCLVMILLVLGFSDFRVL